MKYLAIVSGVFWLGFLISLLVARFSPNADEPIAAIIGMMVFGGLAILSTIVLVIVGLVKVFGG